MPIFPELCATGRGEQFCLPGHELVERRTGRRQENAVAVKHGRLVLRELVLDVPETVKAGRPKAAVAKQPVPLTASQDGRRMTLRLDEAVVLDAGQTLTVVLSW